MLEDAEGLKNIRKLISSDRSSFPYALFLVKQTIFYFNKSIKYQSKLKPIIVVCTIFRWNRWYSTPKLHDFYNKNWVSKITVICTQIKQ